MLRYHFAAEPCLAAAVLLLGLPHIAAAQALPAPDSLPPGVTMEMVESGRAIFRGAGLCTNCHGPEAEGDVGPDLTDDDWLHEKGSYRSIMEVVMDGVPVERSSTGTEMPVRGGTEITDGEVESVAAYVWRKSHPTAGDSLPHGVTEGMIRLGESLFLGKAGCALCHGTDATGLLGPDLTDDEWLDAKGSFLTIGRIINLGVPIGESTRGVAMPPRGGSEISPRDVERVAAYVWYLSHHDSSEVRGP